MPVHRVEGVDLRRLGGSADGSDVFGDNVHRCQGVSGEIDLGSGCGKGACDRPPIAPPAP
jgi:hypothetical protein